MGDHEPPAKRGRDTTSQSIRCDCSGGSSRVEPCTEMMACRAQRSTDKHSLTTAAVRCVHGCTPYFQELRYNTAANGTMKTKKKVRKVALQRYIRRLIPTADASFYSRTSPSSLCTWIANDAKARPQLSKAKTYIEGFWKRLTPTSANAIVAWYHIVCSRTNRVT